MKAVLVVVASTLWVPSSPAPVAPPPAFFPQERDPGAAQTPPFPAGYLDHDALGKALAKLAAEHPKVAAVESLAKTGEGRDLWLVTLARKADGPAAPRRPAILVVANLEADHLVGSQVALGVAEALAAAADDPASEVGKLFERANLYILPRLNPDGAERLLKGTRLDLRTNLRPVDRDRDGRLAEDGPDDLDGDGLILRMRRKDAAKATLVADEKDPRILRKAEPIKGEKAVYVEEAEGLDDDGDGAFNEDGPGGVNLNRNWPFKWTEFEPETGVWPTGEPETLALVKFAVEHPELVAVLTYSLNDNLRADDSRKDAGIDGGDAPFFADLTKLYNQAIAPPKTAEGKDGPPPPALDRSGATTDGALAEWAYHQFGVLGLSARPWSGPEIPAPAEGQPAPPADGEARWLYWNDKVANGAAFVPFREIDHPKLGKIEIGGWKPGVRLNPPADRVGELAKSQTAFVADLLKKVPALAIPAAKAEAKGGGVFQITATVENAGAWPTALAQGLRTRTAAPVMVRLKLPEGAKLLGGKAIDRVESLAGNGGRQEFRWLVLAPAGAKTIAVEAETPKAGRVRKDVDLK